MLEIHAAVSYGWLGSQAVTGWSMSEVCSRGGYGVSCGGHPTGFYRRRKSNKTTTEVNMDISFNCPSCKQEMLVDAADVGREVECPACGANITIPEPDTQEAGTPPEAPVEAQAEAVHPVNAMSSSAAAKESKHYAVPAHERPSEALISKPNKRLEVAAKESDKTMRIRTIRRTDCVEVGKDLFDQRVSDFLVMVGEANVISINTIAYTHVDLGSHQMMTDFGVMIVFKG